MGDIVGGIVDDGSINCSDSQSSKNELGNGSFHESSGESGTYSKDSEDKNKQNKQEISQAESKVVNRLRLILFFSLLLVTASISIIVYFISSHGQSKELESQYLGVTEQLTNAFKDIVIQNIAVMGSLRVSMMAHEADHAQYSWPFVTLSSFHRRSSTVLLLSKGLYLAFYIIVQDSDKTAWEAYIGKEGKNWIEESLEYDAKAKHKQSFFQTESMRNQSFLPIYYTNGSEVVIDEGPGPFAPIWQMSPLVPFYTNFNVLRPNIVVKDIPSVLDSGKAFIGQFSTSEPGGLDSPNGTTASYAGFVSSKAKRVVDYEGDPISPVLLPLYGSYEENDKSTVAVLSVFIQWKSYFENVLPVESKGIVCVIDNSCQDPFSYLVEGNNVTFLGKGNKHAKEYDSWVQTVTLAEFDKIEDGSEFGIELNNTFCPVTLKIYPTKEFYDEFVTSMPLIMMFTVLIMFIVTVILFVFYDRLVERRQHLVLTKAIRTTNIVSSLFPQNVADRILDQGDDLDPSKNHMSTKSKLKSLLSPNDDVCSSTFAQPIADLFPHTTVMFADISGFTAWSSSREPLQVFVLLQGVYQAFDAIAKRRKVFKVETIGDSYVAVTGLPEPQTNHALIMARFATECLQSMKDVAGSLNSRLGPGTNELSMRMGLHSGPVTGGVLVGDKARFQLFGDTVNTAARMESTGVKDRIQVSPATASLIVAAGKSHWIRPREDHVKAKGKGVLKTFWLNIHAKTSSEQTGSDFAAHTDETSSGMSDLGGDMVLSAGKTSSSHELHIDWVCELFLKQISEVIAARSPSRNTNRASMSIVKPVAPVLPPMDEVVESIALPEFVENNVNKIPNNIQLSEKALMQLRHFVSVIASTYNNNPFHNFEHACHVTMSVMKLLMRVVTPEVDENIATSQLSSHVHNYTHGISDDPITQLAILFSAIIHDADHRGVSNMQLIQEDVSLATKYRNKSVAEQNSLDIAWALLISDQYNDLRCYIFATETELQRFRQVVVNAVLATDIFDKELNDLRKQRWHKAFANADDCSMSVQERKNLQATIVIEHIMQASDVAHTMQHWHVYRAWNANLFKEMYFAYQSGRMERNPCEFWYQGELSFFDNYIIPLAKKLKECNVFGVFSDEYLNYAEKNRAEWEGRGQEIVAEMIDKMS